jgi:hypothetical protein
MLKSNYPDVEARIRRSNERAVMNGVAALSSSLQTHAKRSEKVLGEVSSTFCGFFILFSEASSLLA